MKKKLMFSLLAVSLLICLALAMSIIPGAETQSTDVLDVSQGEGMVFDGLQLYSTGKSNPVTEIPVTYEAWIKAPRRLQQGAGRHLRKL